MKKMLLLLVLTLTFSCSEQVIKNEVSPREYQLGAYLWQQRSGEYRALCYQAYSLATSLVKRDLEDKHNRKRAVIFDIDETVLDNSFGGAYEVKNNIPWNQKNFDEWVKKADADSVPGAIEFINFLVANRVEPIFLSNRSSNQLEDTMKNFDKLGIKNKKENFILMTNEWGKESRRLEVLKKYDVVLYIGDNLHDFNKIYNDKTADERKKITDEIRQEFGSKYIILPNPLYGDWEKSLPKTTNKRDLLLPR